MPLSSGNYHSSGAWKKVRAAFLSTMSDHSCMQCGKQGLTGIDLQGDHINPVHQGNGEYEWDNSFDNLRVLCSQCNGKKGDRVVSGKKRMDWKNLAW